MPLTIEATAGSSEANSFVTLEEAQDYFDFQFGATAWENATEEDQKKALVLAGRKLTRLLFIGRPLSASQALPFPRGYDSPSSLPAMPQEVKDAQCEEALAILQASVGAAPPDEGTSSRDGVKSYTIGAFSVTYADSAVGSGNGVRLESAEATKILQRWLRQTADLDPGCSSIAVNSPEAWWA